MIKSLLAISEGNTEEQSKNDKIIKTIDQYLMSLNPVKTFSNENDSMAQMDLNFENLCTTMEEAGIHKPKSLSTFEFESKLNYFQNKKKNEYSRTRN